MKLIALILVTFIGLHKLVIADECNLPISLTAEKLSNSLKPKICMLEIDDIKTISRSYKNIFSENERAKVCKNCDYPNTFKGLLNLEYKPKIVKSAFNDLRKGMSKNILDLLVLRSNGEFNLDPKDSKSSCNIKSYASLKENEECFKSLNKLVGHDIASHLQTQFANEITNLISNKSLAGLFERVAPQNSNVCEITEQDILIAQVKNIESLFSKQVIRSLKSIPFTEPNSTMEKITEIFGQSKVTLKELRMHPILNSLFNDFNNNKSPYLKNFVASLNENDSPEDIKRKINSRVNSEIFNNSLNSYCKKSFDTIKSSLCSEEFMNGNLSLDTKYAFESVDLLTAPTIDEKKQVITNFCRDLKFKNDKTIPYSSISSVLNSNLLHEQSELTYEEYRKQGLDNLIATDKLAFLNLEKNNSCTNNTQNLCKKFEIQAQLKAQRCVKKEPLAYDKNINSILSEIINGPIDISEETKIELVKAGILQDDTVKIPQKDKAVSYQDISKALKASPGNATSSSTNSPNSKPSDIPSGNISNANVNPENQNAASAASQTTQNPTTATSTNKQTPTKSPIDDEERINKEILRRMSNLSKKPNRETTKLTDQDIENLINDTFKQNNRSISPSELAQEKDKFYKNIPKYINNLQSKAPIDQRSVSPITGNPAVQNRPGTLPGKTIDPQNRSSASETSAITNSKSNPVTTTAQKTVIKVKTDVEAIVITLKDEKIKESSEIKNLIANKTDFVLEVNGIPFTINFPNSNDVNSEKLTIATNTSGPIAQGIKEKLETYFHSQEVTNQIRLTNLNNILGTLKF